MGITETLPAPAVPVDRSRVVDYDIYGDSRFVEQGDLHLGLYALGEEVGRGIFWTPRNGGHWFINDHELLFDAARNPEIFSSNNRESQDGTLVTIPPMERGTEPRFAPQSLDPPDHGVYRMPLMRAFAPARVLQMEAGIRELAIGLIDDLRARGRAEFLQEIAEPLPVTVFMKMMGMPLERLAEFRNWMHKMASNDNAMRIEAFANIHQAMGELIAARMEKREDDLISQLLDSDLRGRNPNLEDMHSYCLLLFTAGLDTLVNTFTFGMYHLARDAALQDRIRADRSLIPDFIEEILRRYGISMPPRLVARDAEFGGVKLSRGELVLLMLPAGNLDDEVFPNSREFDLDRENKVHVTFNSGPHRCVGSHLARLELRVFFEEWFNRMPNVMADPRERPTYRAGLNLTICKLPLIWDSTAAAGAIG